jgi:ribosomal protein S18 acetylase RimI-like enzyme
MPTPIIKTATVADEAALTAVITLAFTTDPAARWTWPKPQQFLAHFSSVVKAFGGNAYANQSAYYVEAHAGAALWLPPDVQPDLETLSALMKDTGAAEVQTDLASVFERMESYHPKVPHWYLPLIGVDPMQQGKGYGAALMKHALIPCDRDRALAYLESSNPKNIPLYERHGFELLGTIQVGSSPPIFPMLRKPRPTG